MDFKRQLIEGDPVAREPGLDAFHAQAMRQRVILEARDAEREGFRDEEREGFSRAITLWWLRPIVVAGALAACLVAGVGIGLRLNDHEAMTSVGRSFQGRQIPPRQLQFATPGGTRVIWTFHQEIDL